MKTFCLSLPEKPERIVRAKEHFAQVGLEAEFFFGLHGDTSGLRTVHLYELDNPGYIMGEHPIAIWLGHYMLLNHVSHAYKEHPEAHVMILEDDARFPETWKEQLQVALYDCPSDFDFLFPGHCCLENTEPAPVHVAGNLYKTSKAQCNHCYIVRVGVLPRVLGSLRRVWAPIDIQLMLEILPQLETYAIIPRLVHQYDTNLPG